MIDVPAINAKVMIRMCMSRNHFTESWLQLPRESVVPFSGGQIGL
jgi:hypothetical protein